MTGEFRGDISRHIFDPKKHFTRVLMQQGRVQLDADWNEQADILLHYVQTLAMDLMGPFAGIGKGFEIIPTNDVGGWSFGIGYGRCYVNGILCENEPLDKPCETESTEPLDYLDYLNQPDYPIENVNIPPGNLPLLVYLDVWERHISCIEDDDIREKALGGADTTTRSKIVWQVKAFPNWVDNFSAATNSPSCSEIWEKWTNVVKIHMQNPHRGCLSAQAKKQNGNNSDPCIISPESRYRGAENQLYRVEIHRGGKAQNAVGNLPKATFKWSRDNGAVVFPIGSINNHDVTLEHLGRDDRSTLNVGDWVEVIDDDYTLLYQSRPSPLPGPRPLARVMKVSLTEMTVTLGSSPNYPVNMDKHPLLRRWDFKPAKSDSTELANEGGAVFGLYVREAKCHGADAAGWLTLEDGVQICFQKRDDVVNEYQAGDYWLIPARRDTGDVEWPYDGNERAALPPHGVEHHYAPLAVIYPDQENWKATPCRCTIHPPLSNCP